MIFAKIVWIYPTVLLSRVIILYLVRPILYPKHIIQQLQSSLIETSCLSCISIAFTSILQLAVLESGDKAGLEIYILWWINTGMAIMACLVLPFVHQLQPPGIQNIPTAMLTPSPRHHRGIPGSRGRPRPRYCPRCNSHFLVLELLPVRRRHSVSRYDPLRPIRPRIIRTPSPRPGRKLR